MTPVVAKALGDVGLPVTGHVSTPLDYDPVDEADVVITLGCNEACAAVAGKRIVDWPVADPQDQDERAVQRVLADLDTRVRNLLSALMPGAQLPPSIFQ